MKKNRNDKAELFVKKCLKLLNMNISRKTEKLFVQVLKFVIVGGTAFIIDYSIMVIYKEIIGLSVLLSALFGFVISVIYNYIASVSWVFDVNENRNKKMTL